MQETDKAQGFFTRNGDIWVRMQSGREVKLGPADKVAESMADYVAEPRAGRTIPRNQVREG